MWLDLFRFGWQRLGGAAIRVLVVFWILIVQRDVRICDRRLLEILVYAAATTLILGGQFDGNARTTLHFVRCMITDWVIVRDPFDAMLLHHLESLSAGRDVDPFAFSIL